MENTPKGWITILAAVCGIAAALLWIKSARVEVWADGQPGPLQTNLVIKKDSRQYDVSGTAEAQSKWSAAAAYAAAASACLQVAAMFL
jgi:hypothetical protein